MICEWFFEEEPVPEKVAEAVSQEELHLREALERAKQSPIAHTEEGLRIIAFFRGALKECQRSPPGGLP